MFNKFLKVLALLFIPIVAYGQQGKSIILNELVDPSPNGIQANKTTAGNARSYYTFNEEIIRKGELKKGDRFYFRMDNEDIKEFEISRKSHFLPGTISYSAREAGSKENIFLFTYKEGRINGQYHQSHNQSVFLSYDNELSHNYVTKEAPIGTEELSCSVHEGDFRTPSFTPSTGNQLRKNKQASANTFRGAPLNEADDDSVTIDILIAYTDSAVTWANSSSFGSIEGVLAQAMNFSQTAMDNSGLRIELRVAHSYKNDYTDDNSDTEAGTHLRRFTQNPANPIFQTTTYNGYMEEVHELRNEYGADLVALVMSEPNTGGIAWMLTDTGGEPAWGFSVNRVQQIAFGYTLVHELGHNMGNAHSKTQTSSASDNGGGLFQYSAGYQDFTGGFHTVMAYSDGLNRVPLFSSPDLTYEGRSAGTDDNRKATDNVRSMKISKRTIASYRSTMVDSPDPEVSTNELTVQMNREDEEAVSIDLSNVAEEGNSLMWYVDFKADNISNKNSQAKKADRKEIKPLQLMEEAQRVANYSGAPARSKTVNNEEVIYSTSFESAEGFFTGGDYDGMSEWRIQSGAGFTISSQNPLSGSQHMRLESDGGSTQFLASPFLGYQLFGEYEFSVDFMVSDTSEVYDFYIYDGRNGEFSSGVIISRGVIYATDLTELDEVSFFSTSGQVEENEKATLRIVYNNTNQTIDYYLDGTLLTQNSYLKGSTPGLVKMLNRNQSTGSLFDIDNLEIKKNAAPYKWLNVETQSGTVFEGDSDTIDLVFNTEGISAGTYETTMVITTNSPTEPEIEVPITFTVNETVSNEESPGVPSRISLEQNYPNPFNPTTTISYSLAQAEKVEIDVFNIQGQKISTLYNGLQQAGEHKITFDASALSSGVYLYRLRSGSQVITKQMVLIK
ncbi:MAG: T9SS type A sorting domain-containing protein [Balneolaceae bacterium]|nr:T9SS type A sorting domain-containing protein [Balneolaceae bacterium]